GSDKMSSIWRTFVFISALFGAAVVGCSSSTSSGDGDDSSEESGRDGRGDEILQQRAQTKRRTMKLRRLHHARSTD
ncbi:hypothetical protein, partial [Hyphococcus sp.]|uniref:hypothetical protein n=1 Tax=Hyphococcus sp. TaxID=2038636 RepID=UPI0035C73C55